MIAFALYLLKVIICSGVLFLYYHLALRNKLFHQWNRFYLLAAIIVSLIVPAAVITISHLNAEETPKTIQLLQVLESADGYLEEVTISTNQSMSSEEWGMIIYLLVSAILLISILFSLAKIVSIIRSHTFQWIDKIKFTSTGVKGTPFSFFHFIFWNREIDLQTETGQQIFQHELVHVKEKHTFDKLFVQMILVLFWCNPFFWIIRRELKMIHEFIADKKAVGEYGTAALAAMILSASYPSQFNSMTNQFFQTSIKRRLAMLTKIQNPKINYLSRLLALLIVVITIAAFTIRTKNIDSNDQENGLISTSDNNLLQVPSTMDITDTIPKNGGANNLLSITATDPKKTPLYILDGIEITEVEVKKIPTETISSINVLKDNSAIEKYGPKGANGVIEIRTKSLSIRGDNLVDFFNPKPLIIVDGKEISENEFKQIDADAVESISVLKGPTATDKYGEKAKGGAIEITLKSTKKIDSTTVSEVTLGGPEIELREHGGPNPGIKITEVMMRDRSDTVPKKANQSKVKEIVVDGERLQPNELRTRPISWEEAKKSNLPVVVDNTFKTSMKEVQLDESEISYVSTATGLPLANWFGEKAVPAVIWIVTKNYKSPDPNQIFQKTEVPPSIDHTEWIRFIQRSFHDYIEEAVKNGVKPGTYTVQAKFIVNIDGTISDVTTLNDPGYGMAKKVIEVMGNSRLNSPKWLPALQNGRPVNAYHVQPITFVIQKK